MHEDTGRVAAVTSWGLTADTRVIEIDPPDAAAYTYLAGLGVRRYLALCRPGRARPPEIPPERCAVLDGDRQLHANNAELLILNGPAARHVWHRQVGVAQHVVVPATGTTSWESRLASRVRRRPRPTREQWHGRDVLVLDQFGGPRPRSTRNYLSPVIGVGGLPARLDAQGITYAVLRWFDRLPDMEPGEDLDVLVADEHLAAFHAVLDEEPGVIPVDLYSVSGLAGSDFRSMAYYPPRLAAQLLAHCEPLPNGYRAPEPRFHFRSLAFHALYHKGARCGVPSDLTARHAQPEHDYTATLAALAPADDFTGPITMESLDDHLAAVGWRPPRDTLAKLAGGDGWVTRRFFSGHAPAIEAPGLVVFLLRERASSPAHVTGVVDTLAEHGFDVILMKSLTVEARQRCAEEVRGGNWGPGPFPASGGGPAVAVVAVDPHPVAPSAADLAQHPALTNANVLTVKQAVRDALTADVPAGEMFNPVHSSDGDADAVHYLELAVPDELDRVLAAVTELPRDRPRPVRASPSQPVGNQRRRASGATIKAAVRRRARVLARRGLQLVVDARTRGGGT